MVQNYRDLRVWQQAIELIPEVYRLIERFPKEEKYALSDQIRRAVFQ
jgi:four helix bundle protein